MDIDKKSGFVRVPDDMFWRVTSKELHKKTVYTLSLMRRRVRTIRKPRKFWMDEVTTEEYEYTIAQKNFYSSLLQDIDKEIPEGYKSVQTFLGRANDGSDAERILFKVEEVRPQILFETSIKLWIDCITRLHEEALEDDARRTRKLEAEKYVGDYPPKVLYI